MTEKTDMTEKEARAIVYALGTAMLNDDKPAREAVYADLTPAEYRKVIRWAMRPLLYNFGMIAQMQGVDVSEGWAQLAMMNAMGDD